MTYQPQPELLILPKLLDEFSSKRTYYNGLTIVETGSGLYGSTVTLADWVARRRWGFLWSVSLDAVAQQKTHRQLEVFDLAKYCTFRTQSPIKFMSDATWIDFALLHPEDLQAGTEQFTLAMSAGASIVVIKDYQHAAANAVKKAETLGWKAQYTDLYSILKRE